jgi:hypothetical protein
LLNAIDKRKEFPQVEYEAMETNNNNYDLFSVLTPATISFAIDHPLHPSISSTPIGAEVEKRKKYFEDLGRLQELQRRLKQIHQEIYNLSTRARNITTEILAITDGFYSTPAAVTDFRAQGKRAHDLYLHNQNFHVEEFEPLMPHAQALEEDILDEDTQEMKDNIHSYYGGISELVKDMFVIQTEQPDTQLLDGEMFIVPKEWDYDDFYQAVSKCLLSIHTEMETINTDWKWSLLELASGWSFSQMEEFDKFEIVPGLTLKKRLVQKLSLLRAMELTNGFRAQSSDNGKIELSENQESTMHVTETNELTAFEDHVAKEQEFPMLRSTILGKDDPYPNQGMDAVLSRPYTNTFVWTAAQSIGTVLLTLDLPRDHINAHSNLQEKLSNFLYFRANTKLEFRTNSTQFHAGMLGIRFQTHSKQIETGGLPTTECPYRWSTLPGVDLSANTAITTGIEIPYVAPADYWNMNYYDDVNSKGFFATVIVYVVIPLTMSNSTTVPSVDVSYTINFERPEVAGPTLNSITMKAQEQLKLKEKFRAQGRRKEASSMSSQGVISGALSTVSDISGMMTVVPHVGGVASVVAPIAKAASSVAKYFGYDRPTSVQANSNNLRNYVDNMAHGVGLDMSTKLAIDPQNEVTADHTIFGDKKDYSQYKNYQNLPGMISINTVSSATAVNNIFLQLPVTPMMCRYVPGVGANNYLVNTATSFLASLHTYWRGSMKFHVKIYCSSFISFRLRITWVPNALNGPVNNADGAGDYISKIVDVSGDTSTSFAIPYLQDSMYSECVPYDTIESGVIVDSIEGCTNGVLQFSLVNAVSYTENAAAYASIVVYCSAGEDMVFYRPRNIAPGFVMTVNGQIVSNSQLSTNIKEMPENGKSEEDVVASPMATPPFRAQGDRKENVSCIRDIFEQTFEPLIPATSMQKFKFVHGEEIRDFKTLCHRYTNYNLMAEGSVQTGQKTLDDNTIMTSGQGYISRRMLIDYCFNYNRGSRRFKIVSTVPTIKANTSRQILWAGQTMRIATTQASASLLEYPTNQLFGYPENGVTCMDTDQRTTLEFELPYYHNRTMRQPLLNYPRDYRREIIPVIGWTANAASGANEQFTIFDAVGDDYSWGFPLAPPTYWYSSALEKKKTRSHPTLPLPPPSRNSNSRSFEMPPPTRREGSSGNGGYQPFQNDNLL